MVSTLISWIAGSNKVVADKAVQFPAQHKERLSMSWNAT